MTLTVDVQGAQQVVDALRQIGVNLHGPEMITGMQKATLIVTAGAKKNLVGYQSPTVGGADTSDLKSSITPEIRVAAFAGAPTVLGVVGSKKKHAPFVEFDTRRHVTKLDNLVGWARRHGANVFLVMRAISRRGTFGKKYLQRALKENAQKIFDIIGDTVGKIVKGR